MAQAGNQDLTERFIQFYRNYYRDEIGELAQRYPNEQRSLAVDYDDLYQFNRDLAEDLRSQPDQMREYAEEALRLYDLPADVSLGRAHVRIENLPENVPIRGIRVHDDHIGKLISVQGIVRKATDVRPKITESAFECQRCGTMTYIPQTDGGFQEPHECQGCERQGPFRVNFDQSEFVDSQKLRVQESPEGLRGGETPQSIDVDIEDDVTGDVTAGDHVTVVGVLHIEQVEQGNEKSAVFDLYMDGVSIAIEDEEFEDMDITTQDVEEIIELSNRPDIYDAMVESIAPAIYGYEEEKLAMILQLFSGVTKHLPDGSRIRGDLHMLLIGDPGTGKCLRGNTKVTLDDGRQVPIRDLVERNLDDPKPVDDGVWDVVDFEVPALQGDGTVAPATATKVWKREAPATMFRIETESGRDLEVTPSHPLFVQRDGRFTPVVADELDAGEFVATLNDLDVRADNTLEADYRRSKSYNAAHLDLPAKWTPDLARLLGYIVAEGYVELREDYSGFVSITNNDEAVLSDARTVFKSLGLETTTREQHDGKNARELMCFAGEFVSLLDNVDESLLKNSGEKRVPADLFSTSKAVTKAFIKGYIEGEGHVSAAQREITVASMSEHLLEDIRSLLLQHGITTQLHDRKNGSYRIRISGEQFDRYVTAIGFVTNRKQEAAEEHLQTDQNTNVDVVPNVAPVLRRIRKSLGLTQYECGVPRGTYRHYESGSRNPSTESLRNVVEAFEAAKLSTDSERVETLAETDGGTVAADISALRQLVDGDIRWDRIESIEPVEPDYEWVYDLEVEGTHNYVSNGVISHNSQMISYIKNIAPRSVYTSGKGSSSAGLTAAAVRDDFGDGQQWTLEAGALVLADKGIAAVDELDKMRCVAGDTLVQLGDGRVTRIRELAREESADGRIEDLPNGRTIRDVDVEAWTMTDDGRVVQRPVTAIHEYDAPDELTRVTLETGESLTATDDHPFFVFEDGERVEKGAADLDEGDLVYKPDRGPDTVTDGGITRIDPENTTPSVGGEATTVRVSDVSTAEASPDSNVYDLTVEDTHNFVANGMIVHNSEDRSAMHQALEQQQISVNKAGINATLKSRCSLLGAANPKYGRFDQYEPIGEQIDLEPALISRFDLIFTVTDQPDPEHDSRLAQHILKTNYAGELNTQMEEVPTSEFTPEEVADVTEEVAPEIDSDLLRKYIAYAKRNCYPTMTDEAKAQIEEFYVDLRSKGMDEDSPVPVTARQLEALVRLAEASARVRLSDSVEQEDADRATEIVESCLKDIGVDPETGQFDADVVETGTSKSQRDRIKNIKGLIADIEEEYEDGAPIEEVLDRADEIGMNRDKAEGEIEKLRRKGEVYEPTQDHLRTT